MSVSGRAQYIPLNSASARDLRNFGGRRLGSTKSSHELRGYGTKSPVDLRGMQVENNAEWTQMQS